MANFEPHIVSRRDIEDRILADPRAVTVIGAPAGAGKSTFLHAFSNRVAHPVVTGPTPVAQAEWTLWDDPCPGAALPELMPGQRLVIACRPQDMPEGLARDRLYGCVLDIDAKDLLLPRCLCSPTQWERSLGWPLMLSPAAHDDALLRDFISTEILSEVDVRDLWRTLNAPTLPNWSIAAIPPLIHPPGTVGQRLSRLLRDAAETTLGRRLTIAAPVPWLDDEIAQNPSALQTVIARMIQRGEIAGALSLLDQGGGWQLFYRIGQDAFSNLVALFPDESDNIDLVLARALLALKEGEVQHALTLLVNRFGSGIADVLSVVRNGDEYSLKLRIFRIVLLIYEDIVLTDQLLDALFAFAAQIRLNTPMLRGAYYNAMLEFLLRLRRYEEAEDAAGRALMAYEQGNMPLLAFYISLHRAVMRLMRGESGSARQETKEARDSLSKVDFETPGDVRLLKLVETILQFEDGAPQALINFLDHELDEFSHGEIWPSLVELAVIYGSQALCEQVSTRAALAFLDRWRLYMALNRQFRHLIEVRKAQVLQNSGHWGEAAMILAPIQARLDRVWVESAEDEFSRLHARDDILLALSWLRQIAYERPRFPYLERKFEAMRQNPRLTGRQRLSIDIWSAYVARQTRDHGRARALLLQAIEASAQRHSLSVLSEEQIFLAELWADQRMAAFLDASGTARAVRRRLDESRHAGIAGAARDILTRQELKVLMMLTDGATNKEIARRMGLSEPTVKFHLRNLFNKLGVSKRTEAVAAARSLGWIT